MLHHDSTGYFVMKAFLICVIISVLRVTFKVFVFLELSLFYCVLIPHAFILGLEDALKCSIIYCSCQLV